MSGRGGEKTRFGFGPAGSQYLAFDKVQPVITAEQAPTKIVPREEQPSSLSGWKEPMVSARAMLMLMLAMAPVATLASPIEPGAIEVVDGDTIRAGGRTFRLVGFDTPETGSRARCEHERTLAAAASRRLRELVAGGGLDLERVACSCRPGTEGTPACKASAGMVRMRTPAVSGDLEARAIGATSRQRRPSRRPAFRQSRATAGAAQRPRR
jgi:hypothetical protein